MITRLNVASIYVLDKEEALDFYVNKLGLEKGNDVRQGDYRWLTVRVPGQPETEVSLEQPGPPLHDEATAAQLRELIAMGGRPPIGETLDFVLVDAGDGFAAFEAMPSLRAYNPLGTVHGGYAATLLDSACGCAAHSRLTPSQGYTTLELKVAYHKAITQESGRLRAEGRVLSSGRRAAFAEATLKGVDGRLYASATSTLLVFER